ncbi:MAG TPA: C1 family peptidase [Fimbriimonas sp.]|nr:C1 family peptidase [Fimbriimonas sp.]
MSDLLAPKASGAITPDDLLSYIDAFDSDPAYRASMNAVCTTTASKVALNRRKSALVDNSFSHHLPENSATSQNGSGRCWMFAALNTFRTKAMQGMNISDNFELSQNYTMFWDKLEKANYFLENILATLHEPIGSRTLDFLLASPIQDGGQWHMFVNLIKKYGVVPKTVMPETESSSSTGRMNDYITGKLRDYSCALRNASEGGATKDKLKDMKSQQMAEVYRMLCIHLGEPPRQFLWQWRDKDKVFHRTGEVTPQEFYDKFVGIKLEDMVCIIHDPRPQHQYNQVYTVKLLGNVVGGHIVEYLNVDIETMKQAAIKQIQAGDPVWFGCDVGQFLERDLGVMDRGMFDYGLLYGTEQAMSKAERLQYRQSQMTHAMVFTGVDLDEDGRPRKWRVENSWSDKPGDKGFFQMSDAWFDEFNYEVVVHKNHMPGDVLKALDKKPVALDPWDPMGSLA